eukprot:TRINITY_DN5574_c0_g2_i1.p1 TRINITY_DN5574_c0_g2~~TRINITY_DN5574_c0_g2_i1.p1  ORF type:complete len:413 (+),score=45.11 TRINITY_DN5574_c0_g2_i1:147-1385(+)
MNPADKLDESRKHSPSLSRIKAHDTSGVSEFRPTSKERRSPRLSGLKNQFFLPSNTSIPQDIVSRLRRKDHNSQMMKEELIDSYNKSMKSLLQDKPVISAKSSELAEKTCHYSKSRDVFSRLLNSPLQRGKSPRAENTEVLNASKGSPELTSQAKTISRSVEDLFKWAQVRAKKLEILQQEKNMKAEEVLRQQLDRGSSFFNKISQKIIAKKTHEREGSIEDRLLNQKKIMEERKASAIQELALNISRSSRPKINSNTNKLLSAHYSRLLAKETAVSEVLEKQATPSKPDKENSKVLHSVYTQEKQKELSRLLTAININGKGFNAIHRDFQRADHGMVSANTSSRIKESQMNLNKTTVKSAVKRQGNTMFNALQSDTRRNQSSGRLIRKQNISNILLSVSYTHLTLPTIYSV